MRRIVNRVKREVVPQMGFLLDRPVNHHLFIKDARKRYRMSKIVETVGGNIEYKNREWTVDSEYGRVSLREDGSDIDVYWQILIQEEYRTVVETAVLNGIDVNVIVDAGSNIGLTSLFFAKHFPKANIIALEPDSDNYRQASKNTASTAVKPKLLQQALWSTDKVVYVHDDFRDARDWARSVSTEETSQSVEGISLASLMSSNALGSIDILKMDIEGAEAEIFSPNADHAFLDKTKIVAIEIHDEFGCRESIYKILRKRGYVLYSSGELTVGLNTAFKSNAVH